MLKLEPQLPLIYKSKAKLEVQPLHVRLSLKSLHELLKVWLLCCSLTSLHKVWDTPEVNDSQDKDMGHRLLAVLQPWSKFYIHGIKRSEIRKIGRFPKLLLLLQELLEELFGVLRQFFNSLILVACLLYAKEELFTKCFQQNLHGCIGDIVVQLECPPISAWELAVCVK